MSQVLPPLFIAVSALALVLALYAFWQSLRVFWESDAPRIAVPPSAAARMALIDEKAALLKALKELTFERDMGKISEQDYEVLNARYRSRAKQVLRELDQQLGQYRGRAESLVASTLNAAASQTKVAAEPGEGETPEPRTSEADKPAGAKARGSKPKGAKTKKKITAAATQPESADEPHQTASDRVACGGCDTPNELDAAFCKKCGKRLGEEAQS